VSKLHILASRSSPKGETYVRFDWSQGLIAELTEAEYTHAMNTQAPAAGASTGKPRYPSEELGWAGEGDEDAA
jgi:hypothetical protein